MDTLECYGYVGVLWIPWSTMDNLEYYGCLGLLWMPWNAMDYYHFVDCAVPGAVGASSCKCIEMSVSEIRIL